MSHSLMVDLETLGTGATAAIVEIGAIVFDPEGDPLPDLDVIPTYNKYFGTVNLDSCLSHGLTLDASTLAWWMEQYDEQRLDMSREIIIGADLKVAFWEFAKWVRSHSINRVWSHGATFDIPILEHISRKVGHSLPWAYGIARDTRTLFDLSGYRYTSKGGDKAHNALADAYRQSIAVQTAWKKLKGGEDA